MSVTSDERQERDAALKDLHLKAVAVKEARAAYEAALWRARHLRVPNTAIARVVGLSEAAIRMYFQRKGKQH